jgi:small-conductance mechanosensitive channel
MSPLDKRKRQFRLIHLFVFTTFIALFAAMLTGRLGTILQVLAQLIVVSAVITLLVIGHFKFWNYFLKWLDRFDDD